MNRYAAAQGVGSSVAQSHSSPVALSIRVFAMGVVVMEGAEEGMASTEGRGPLGK